MSRIYAGTAHTIADIPESFYEELKFLLVERPDAFALLEFVSPGNNHRQIDCAIVSAGGVDLIEVKHKRHPVKGTADGAWATDDGGHLNVFSNRKSGVTENPYQQAANSATDLAWGLAKVLRLRKDRVRVYPMVLIPEAHPDCEIAEHSNVKLALGSDGLRSALRAFHWRAVWSPSEYGDLPERLGLSPVELGHVIGQVVDGETGQPLRGVRINVLGRDESVHSDFRGGFCFMAPLGARLSLVLEPATSHEVTEFELSVSHRHLDLGNVALSPVVTRAARQAALVELEEEFQQRLAALQVASSEQVEYLTALNQTLLDGVQREHDRRRELEGRLAEATQRVAGDLRSQVQQRHELVRVREQLAHSEHLLCELRRPKIQIGDAIRREAAEYLVILRASRMPALPPTESSGAAPGQAARFRVTRRLPVAPVPERVPDATSAAGMPQPVLGLGSRGIWLAALAFTALLGAGLSFWLDREAALARMAPVVTESSSELLSPPALSEASSAEALPGEVVSTEEVAPPPADWPRETLPGEPVNSE